MRSLLSALVAVSASLFLACGAGMAPPASSNEAFYGAWVGYESAFQPCGRFANSNNVYTHWRVSAGSDGGLSLTVAGDFIQGAMADVRDGVATIQPYTSASFMDPSGLTETDTLTAGSVKTDGGELDFTFSTSISLSDGSSCTYDAHGSYSKETQQ